MFEQATLTYGQPGKRVWTTFLGLATQVALMSFAVLAPMIWPQAMPPAPLLTTWVPSVPPPPQKRAEPTRDPAVTRVVPRTQFRLGQLIAPSSIPDKPAVFDDPPATQVIGGTGGSEHGLDVGVPNSWFTGLDVIPVRPPAPVAPVRVDAVKPAVVTVPVVRVGGVVKMPRLVRRVDPLYPGPARAARVSGTVVLAGLIGTDGRIRELQLTSGNPLLVRAALEAVGQWVYEPSQLNGVPCEIRAEISVVFKLN